MFHMCACLSQLPRATYTGISLKLAELVTFLPAGQLSSTTPFPCQGPWQSHCPLWTLNLITSAEEVLPHWQAHSLALWIKIGTSLGLERQRGTIVKSTGTSLRMETSCLLRTLSPNETGKWVPPISSHISPSLESSVISLFPKYPSTLHKTTLESSPTKHAWGVGGCPSLWGYQREKVTQPSS